MSNKFKYLLKINSLLITISSNTNQENREILMLPVFCPIKCKNKHSTHVLLFWL